MVKRLACSVLLAVATLDVAADVAYRGEARAPSGDLLYLEEHLLRRDDGGRPIERLVLYRCEGTQAFARKRVRYDEKPQAPDFELEDRRLGYRESHDDGLVSVRRRADADTAQARLPADPARVVDAGFDEFVRAHWDRLETGERVPLAFLVPSRLTTYRFSLRKSGEDVVHGEPVSVFRLALSGVFGWFADPIDVAYRQRDRRLMRFDGVSNIRGADGRNLVARIEFPPMGEQAIDDPAQLEQRWRDALATPLGDCRG